MKTKIEWTDYSWNPIRAKNRTTGKIGWTCEHVSEGCRNCYAEGINRRLGTGLPFKPGHREDLEIFLDEKMLLAPLRWKRPRMIFVCSMTDLFADFVPDAMIDQVFAVMAASQDHVFQVLTKRSARMRSYLGDPGLPLRLARSWCFVGRDSTSGWSTKAWRPDGPNATPRIWPLPNIWLGVSCEDRPTADARIPELLATPAAVRWVSYEPALGPVDFTKCIHVGFCNKCGYCGSIDRLGWHPGCSYSAIRTGGLDWIVAGGESGPHARPAHPDWFRSVRDQCAADGVPFLFKQWGTWAPLMPYHFLPEPGPSSFTVFHDQKFERVGKKAAGRLLDGVEHNGMPARAKETAP